MLQVLQQYDDTQAGFNCILIGFVSCFCAHMVVSAWRWIIFISCIEENIYLVWWSCKHHSVTGNSSQHVSNEMPALIFAPRFRAKISHFTARFMVPLTPPLPSPPALTDVQHQHVNLHNWWHNLGLIIYQKGCFVNYQMAEDVPNTSAVQFSGYHINLIKISLWDHLVSPIKTCVKLQN